MVKWLQYSMLGCHMPWWVCCYWIIFGGIDANPTNQFYFVQSLCSIFWSLETSQKLYVETKLVHLLIGQEEWASMWFFTWYDLWLCLLWFSGLFKHQLTLILARPGCTFFLVPVSAEGFDLSYNWLSRVDCFIDDLLHIFGADLSGMLVWGLKIIQIN